MVHDLSSAARTLLGRKPSMPEGLRFYVIGDIHGRVDLLEQLFSLIDYDLAESEPGRSVQLFLGDYIDRGASSRATIDKLIERAEIHECAFLRGNHEAVAVSCLTDKASIPAWMRIGGAETLLSYGVRPTLSLSVGELSAIQSAFQSALPRSHLQFFGRLQTQLVVGDYFFVHAGIRPGIPLTKQKERDLLWIRDEFLASTQDHGKVVVHGHTPSVDVEYRPNRINIDTGAYFTNRLTCLVLESNQRRLIQTKDASCSPL